MSQGLELPRGYSVRYDEQTGWHWYNDVADIPSEGEYASEAAAVVGAWKDYSLSRHLNVGALVSYLERNEEPYLAEKIHYTSDEDGDTRSWRMESFSVMTNAYHPESFEKSMRNWLSQFLVEKKPVAVTRGVLDEHHRFGRIEYLGDANVPKDGTPVFLDTDR